VLARGVVCCDVGLGPGLGRACSPGAVSREKIAWIAFNGKVIAVTEPNLIEKLNYPPTCRVSRVFFFFFFFI